MSPELILGEPLAVFVTVTLVCMCGCAAAVGVCIAREWRPARHVLPFALVLCIADRVMAYVLFKANFLAPGSFILGSYCILMSALLGYRLQLASQLARQYPWMYRRFLAFGWRRARN